MKIKDFEECSICEDNLPGIISVNGLVFCAKCERREFAHSVRLMEKAVQSIRQGWGSWR